MKSDLITSLQNIVEASMSGNSDDNEILLKIRLLSNRMDERSTNSNETFHLSKLMDSALTKFLESNLNRINLNSGLPSFDEKYGGLAAGEFVVHPWICAHLSKSRYGRF